jgi:hypothetical protein
LGYLNYENYKNFVWTSLPVHSDKSRYTPILRFNP